MKEKWYQFKAITDDTTELLIYGDIEDYKWVESDVTAYDFAKELTDIETPNLKVRINSYGGSVASGLAIYNLLKSSNKYVTTINDGFACSAASIIFCAGKERIMPNTALFLAHPAWSSGVGNANDFRKMAEDLDVVTQPSIEAYKSVSKLSEKEIKELMDKEKWLTADQCLEYGFATKISDNTAQQSINSEFYLRNAVLKVKDLEQKVNALNIENQELKNKKEEIEPNYWDQYFGG